MSQHEKSVADIREEEDGLVQQFDSSETILLNGQSVEVVDITPTNLKTEVPTLVLPGFSATPEALKDAIVRTAQAGRRVISANAPHGIEVGEVLPESDLPAVELKKLELVLRLIEAKGLDTVDVIAHSEASIYVTAAALACPERFRSIVLVDPAGLIGDDGFFALINRARKDMKLEKAHSTGMIKVAHPSPTDIGARSVLADIPASIREILAIANSDIIGALEDLHNLGMCVAILHGVDDGFFPMDRVQELVKRHMIDGFYSVAGTHNAMYSYEPYGRVIEEALTTLNNKYEKRKHAHEWAKSVVEQLAANQPEAEGGI